MSHEEADYLRRREPPARAAAKAAVHITARQAHQHLAGRYAARLHGLASDEPWPMVRCEGL